MQLEIRRRNVEIDETARTRLERRVEFALGRLGRHVARVWVHLSEDATRGFDKRCRVLVRLQHLPDVLVEDHHDDLNTLIDRAVNRAGLAARRELNRRYQH